MRGVMLGLVVVAVMGLAIGPVMASATEGWQMGFGTFLPTMQRYGRAIEMYEPAIVALDMYAVREPGNGWDKGWKVSLDYNSREPFANIGPFVLNHAQFGYTAFHDDCISGSLPAVFVGRRWDLTGGYHPPSRLHFTLDGGIGYPRIGDCANIGWAWRASADYELTRRLVVFLEHQASQPVRGRTIGLRFNLPQ